MKALTFISRIIVGLLFIISGLIKANDPLGFSYKLDEYFEVFHMDWMSAISLQMAMFISVIEIVLGMAVLVGVYMNATAWALLLMILFFTWLTGYSAITGKVTDCGCFGDAIKLTPKESFYKDLVLLFFILIIFVRRNVIEPLLTAKVGKGLVAVSLVLAAWFTIHCFNHLPVKDFRPYAIGKNIPEQMKYPEGAQKPEYKTMLIYEKDGVEKEFTMEDYPWDDSTWVWKDTKNILVKEGYKLPITDFSITDADGVDHTQDVLDDQEYNFVVVAYNLEKSNLKIQPALSAFAQAAEAKGFHFIGLTATNADQTEAFRHTHQAAYPYYFSDATLLKTIIRSNPGLVLLKGGTIIDMWHHNDLPTFEEFSAKYLK